MLERFKATSQLLKTVNIDVHRIVELYDLLIHVVQSIRACFDEYVKKAIALAGRHDDQFDTKKKKKRKIQFDESHCGEGENYQKREFHSTYSIRS